MGSFPLTEAETHPPVLVFLTAAHVVTYYGCLCGPCPPEIVFACETAGSCAIHPCAQPALPTQTHDYFRQYFFKPAGTLAATTYVKGASPPPLRTSSRIEVESAPVDPELWDSRCNVGQAD